MWPEGVLPLPAAVSPLEDQGGSPAPAALVSPRAPQREWDGRSGILCTGEAASEHLLYTDPAYGAAGDPEVGQGSGNPLWPGTWGPPGVISLGHCRQYLLPGMRRLASAGCLVILRLSSVYRPLPLLLGALGEGSGSPQTGCYRCVVTLVQVTLPS